MKMKKFLCKAVATIVTAAMLVSYGGVIDAGATELEADLDAASVAVYDDTASASLMSSSDYEYTVLSKSKKTIEITGYTGSATKLSIPSKIDGYTVTSIGAMAFFGADQKAKTVTIPSTVTTIGECAFSNSNITSVSIPDSVTSIGRDAFAMCPDLKSLTIPASVTSIGDTICWWCESLTSIKVDEDNKYYSSKDGVLYNKKKTKLICCPGGKTGSFTIPSTVTDIADEAFYYCDITSVSMPDGLKSIGDYAFCLCSCLASIEIPTSVTSIGSCAFEGCFKLADIYYAGTKTQWNKISFGDNWNDECSDDMTIFYGIKSVSLKTTSYTYNGSEKKPGVVVKDGDGNTLSSKYYTVSYKNNKKVGTGTVSIKFKNGYSGTATQTFKINPKGTSLSSVTKSSKAFTVKWKKQSTKMSTSNITGYQIQYSTSSSFSSGNKSVTVNGYSNTSKKITGLKAKTKYYVRIRTYKSISGTKYYSSWSETKSVTTK